MDHSAERCKLRREQVSISTGSAKQSSPHRGAHSLFYNSLDKPSHLVRIPTYEVRRNHRTIGSPLGRRPHPARSRRSTAGLAGSSVGRIVTDPGRHPAVRRQPARRCASDRRCGAHRRAQGHGQRGRDHPGNQVAVAQAGRRLGWSRDRAEGDGQGDSGRPGMASQFRTGRRRALGQRAGNAVGIGDQNDPPVAAPRTDRTAANLRELSPLP